MGAISEDSQIHQIQHVIIDTFPRESAYSSYCLLTFITLDCVWFTIALCRRYHLLPPFLLVHSILSTLYIFFI